MHSHRSWTHARTPFTRGAHPSSMVRSGPSRTLAHLLLSLLVLVAGCSSSNSGATNPAIQSLTLTPSGWQADAEVGQSAVLQTKVTDASGSPVSGIVLSYSSSDTTVLRVKNEGGTQAVVTAVRPGTVQLTVGLASSESGTGTASSVSVQVTVDLAGVAIERSGTPLELSSVGDSGEVQGHGLDVAGNTVADAGLTWSVAGTGVVRVTPFAGGDSASVVAVGAGTDTVKATASLCVTGCGATRVVEVKQAVASITVSPDSAAIVAGDSAVFTAKAFDASGAPVMGAPIRWTIGDPTLATVDTSGVVHAWHTGVTQVIAFDDAVNAKVTVNVVPGPATQLVFTTQPHDTATQTALSPAVAVSEKDAYGNVAAGATDSVTMAFGSNPGGATLGGTTTEAATSGVATFGDLSVNKAGSGYTLVASASGLPSATSAAFDIHNNTPIAGADADTTLEDSALVVAAPGVLGNDKSPAGNPLTAKLVTGPSHGTLVLNANGSFTYTPAANYNGSDGFTYKSTDGTFTSAATPVTLTITPVNDAPSYTAGSNQTVLEDAGPQSVAWATSISAGPSNESGQTVHFTVTSTDSTLFSAQPAISPSGTLTYTAAPDSNGVDTVSVQLWDNGGTANGGVDSTTVSTFVISVTAVNDAPSFTLDSTNVTVLEDATADTMPGFLAGLSAGPANESSQTVTVSVANSNATIFSAAPAIDTNGQLTFTLATDSIGTDTVTVTAQDNGGTANGGVDTTSHTFMITVTAVNDAPSYTAGSNQTVLENAAAQSVSWATNLSTGSPHESSQTLTFTVTSTNSALFSALPAISASGTLTYAAASDSFGVDTVSVVLKDNGGTANGGVDSTTVSRFTITVTHVNQPPTFTHGADPAVWNGAGAQTLTSWATISPGPANESSQIVTLSMTNTSTTLFTVAPAINSSTGTLTFTPVTAADGVDTVTVKLKDNGGTANGGVDTASTTFTIAVGPVAYVANTLGYSVSVINMALGTVTKTIGAPAYSDPYGIAITPDGTEAYTTYYASNTVSVIDLAKDSVTQTIGAGTNPDGLAITPDGAKAYMIDYGSNAVSVIDVAADTVFTNTIAVGKLPEDVAVTPDGTKAYVTNDYAASVSVIDVAKDSVTKTIGVGSYPAGVAVTPDGTKAYVANGSYSGTVSVIDVAKDSVTKTIGVGNYPAGVAVTPNGTEVYVVNNGGNSVSVINVGTGTVMKTIGVGAGPQYVAITPDGTKALVTNQSSNTVSVIDVASGLVTKTIGVGSEPTGIAIH